MKTFCLKAESFIVDKMTRPGKNLINWFW